MTIFLILVMVTLVALSWTLRASVVRRRLLLSKGIASIRSNAIVGPTIQLVRMRRSVPRSLSIPSYLLSIGAGMAKLYQDKGMFLLDAGIFKQVVVLFSAESTKVLLSDPKEVAKSVEYDIIKDFLGVALLNSPPKKWSKQRRLLSPAFHPSILQDVFHPVMNRNVHVMVQKIRSLIRKDEKICVEEVVGLCILDIITETAMGVKIGAQRGGDVPYFTSLNKILEILAKRILSPWLWPELIFWLTPSGRELRRHIRVVRTFVKELIPVKQKQLLEERRQEEEQDVANPDVEKQERRRRRPFLELMLLHNMDCKVEDQISQKELEDQTHTFTFGGSDTVTNAVSWTLYYMGLYPRVMRKAYQEVDAIFNGNKVRPITVEDIKHMEYIERIIKESIRLTPAVPAVLRELREDLTIKGVAIPKGTIVCVFFFALHRDPEVFPDPEIFDPNRFLDTSISPYAFAPFSAGPRGCIGKQFAMMELKTLLGDLVRNFTWTSLDHRDVVLPSPDIVTRPHAPFRIIFTERE